MEATAKNSSHSMIKRMIPPITVWAIGKVLAIPRVKKRLREVDAKFYKQKREAERTVARKASNATKNRGWLAAGAAAIAIGIGLMGYSTKR